MTNRTEAQLRLDTLTRQLEAPAHVGAVAKGVAVAVGLAVLVLLQVYLFAPVFASVTSR
jgi:hypothetical protein